MAASSLPAADSLSAASELLAASSLPDAMRAAANDIASGPFLEWVREHWSHVAAFGLAPALPSYGGIPGADTVLIECLHGHSWGRHFVFGGTIMGSSRYDGMQASFEVEIDKPVKGRMGAERPDDPTRASGLRTAAHGFLARQDLPRTVYRHDPWPIYRWARDPSNQWTSGWASSWWTGLAVAFAPVPAALLANAVAGGAWQVGAILGCFALAKFAEWLVLSVSRAITYIRVRKFQPGSGHPRCLSGPPLGLEDAIMDVNERRVRYVNRSGAREYLLPVVEVWPNFVSHGWLQILQWPLTLRYAPILMIATSMPHPFWFVLAVLVQARFQQKACAEFVKSRRARRLRAVSSVWRRSLERGGPKASDWSKRLQ